MMSCQKKGNQQNIKPGTMQDVVYSLTFILQNHYSLEYWRDRLRSSNLERLTYSRETTDESVSWMLLVRSVLLTTGGHLGILSPLWPPKISGFWWGLADFLAADSSASVVSSGNCEKHRDFWCNQSNRFQESRALNSQPLPLAARLPLNFSRQPLKFR